MKYKLARKKYKKWWIEMQPHLDGITVCVDKDGDSDIPECDLQRAFEEVTKGHSDIEWD